MQIEFFASKLLSKHQLLRRFIANSCCRLNPHDRLYDTPVKLDDKTVRFLEKLSLVNFENQKNISVVESAIEFANDINAINTDNVEPLVTVLEDRSLKLREDIVADGNCKKEVLQNAAITEEDYFVAPPGNIPVNLQKLKTD